jgi:hypothetical protein
MNLIKKWQAYRQRCREKTQQQLYEAIGEPIFIVDFEGKIRPSRLKRHGKHLMVKRSEILDDWIEACPNGTITSSSAGYLKKWYYANGQYLYPDKILNSILRTKEILPVLMGIDEDLDKLIDKELRC